jgi:hypothetical protein
VGVFSARTKLRERAGVDRGLSVEKAGKVH